MKKQYESSLPARTVAYTLRRSRHARRMRLAVYANGRVVLTCPAAMPGIMAE